MKSIYIFIMTMVCGLIGSTIGVYISFKLWDMYGAWSVIPILGLVLLIMGILYFTLGHMMENVPVIDVLKYDDPEDELDKPQ